MVKLQVNGFNTWQVSNACSTLNRRELTSRLAFAATIKHFKRPRWLNNLILHCVPKKHPQHFRL